MRRSWGATPVAVALALGVALEGALVSATPDGFQTTLLPADVIAAARSELEMHMVRHQRKLEMRFSFTSLRGGRGRLRRLPGPERYPACDDLMRTCQRRFGLEGNSVCSPDLVQVMVRQYRSGQGLRLHVDSAEMFEEPVLAVVLRAGGAEDGLNLQHMKYPERKANVDEVCGLAMCFKGASRYEWGHEVPPVTARRLSITWRWFRRSFLEAFKDF
mmetsp:Transcript_34757/g.64678  ORF Transcript_34757/g.64678 Transcript_34757/m.64678 type:complete len:216 (+) Transcript_34757:53-700(+)